MFDIDTSTCRGPEQGYRRLEVADGKDDVKPKASKLSGGSLRVMGGPKQRWEMTRIKESSKSGKRRGSKNCKKQEKDKD